MRLSKKMKRNKNSKKSERNNKQYTYYVDGAGHGLGLLKIMIEILVVDRKVINPPVK